jgi:hypothetical protein
MGVGAGTLIAKKRGVSNLIDCLTLQLRDPFRSLRFSRAEKYLGRGLRQHDLGQMPIERLQLARLQRVLLCSNGWLSIRGIQMAILLL